MPAGHQFGEVDRLLVQGERRRDVSGLAQRRDAPGPGLQARPRHLEDRAHGDLDRTAVEGVGTVRGEQYRVHAERGGTPEEGADVGVVVHGFQDHDAARGRDHLGDPGQRLAVEGGEDPAVQVEADQPLGDRVVDHVHRGVEGVGHVVEHRAAAPGEQQRTGAVSGAQRTAHHLLPLGQEQPVLGLQAAAEAAVPQPHVVGQPLVGGIGHLDDVHGPIVVDPAHRPAGTAACPRRRLRPRPSRATRPAA